MKDLFFIYIVGLIAAFVTLLVVLCAKGTKGTFTLCDHYESICLQPYQDCDGVLIVPKYGKLNRKCSGVLWRVIKQYNGSGTDAAVDEVTGVQP